MFSVSLSNYLLLISLIVDSTVDFYFFVYRCYCCCALIHGWILLILDLDNKAWNEGKVYELTVAFAFVLLLPFLNLYCSYHSNSKMV